MGRPRLIFTIPFQKGGCHADSSFPALVVAPRGRGASNEQAQQRDSPALARELEGLEREQRVERDRQRERLLASIRRLARFD